MGIPEEVSSGAPPSGGRSPGDAAGVAAAAGAPEAPPEEASPPAPAAGAAGAARTGGADPPRVAAGRSPRSSSAMRTLYGQADAAARPFPRELAVRSRLLEQLAVGETPPPEPLRWTG